MKIELEAAAIITKLRVEAGYSKKEVATAIGVSPATYSKFEKGQGKIRSSHLLSLAMLYDKSCEYIIGRESDPYNDSIDKRRLS